MKGGTLLRTMRERAELDSLRTASLENFDNAMVLIS